MVSTWQYFYTEAPFLPVALPLPIPRERTAQIQHLITSTIGIFKRAAPSLKRLKAILPRPPLDKWLPLLVLAASLAVTAYTWRHEQHSAEQVLQSDFAFHVHEEISAIKQRFAAYQQVLQGAGALFAASAEVERQSFDDYVTALRLQQSHPGIRNLSFIRSREYNAESAQQGQQDGHVPVVVRAPGAGDEPTPTDFDADAKKARNEAMAFARDHGTVVLSKKIVLPPDARSKAQPSFMMYLPVYRKGARPAGIAQHRANLAGWIAAEIRIADLMAPPAHREVHELDVELYDSEPISGQALLFDTDKRPMHASAAPSRYQAIRRLQFANHAWTVAVRSLPPFEARLDRSSTVKAWFGVGASLLLTLIAWLLVSSRVRADAVAREVHRKLIERETRYRHMFTDSASMAFVADPGNGRIVAANRAAEAFWGYPLNRLSRMSIFEITAAPHDGVHTLLREAASGEVARLECRHRLADDELRDVELCAGKLLQQGQVLVQITMHDVTARKRAEQILRASEERFRLIAENSGDVVWMMDAQTLRITYVSPSVESQTGYTPEEILARHADAPASHPPRATARQMAEMTQHLRERIDRANAGDNSQLRETWEIELPCKNGASIPVEVVSTLLCDEDNMPNVLVGVCRNISAQRAAQEEQKRFMAMVSHEFRTPLATIDGAVQRLQSTAGQVDAATHHRFTKIQKAVDRLTALLDDYLTQDSIGTAGRGLHLSLASPLALLRDAKASAHTLSAGHVVEIDTQHAPESFLCDADRMRLVLRILADNAVKYTLPGSRIMLRAARGAHGGIEFVVADNGRGIPKNELPHVFDKFFRGLGASRQSGSGLGLHMARLVVQMHGGTLSACNRPEGGAQFTVWLPDRARDQGDSARSNTKASSG